MPRLGATYVPGHEDFRMPEVVAPAPQRVISGVQQHMDDGLERMEFEAREAANSKRRQNTAEPFEPFYSRGATASPMDMPSFSPYPKVKGENVPPNDEEREEILSVARASVLHSNDFRIQLDWARDVLSHVEAAAEARTRAWRRDGGGEGERPRTPAIEHDLRMDAINIVDFLAQQQHPDAMFMKGKWLEFGKFGHRENKKDAYAMYVQAAENGSGRAEYRIGMLFENANDIDQAMHHYTTGVGMDDSASHYRMGMMHLMGQHRLPRDPVKALDMIQQAADTADSDAPQGAYVYGLLIARELPDMDLPEGILPLDILLARQYIEKAAYLGFAKAQLKMGQAYELCQLGCQFDAAMSLHYYGLAATQGQAEASLGASRWFLFGYEGAFPKDEKRAYMHAQDAASAGLATGEFALGYYHEIGVHVPKDLQEARRWYALAAEHGNKDAQDRIDQLSQAKTLTKRDHETTTLTRIKSMHASQRGKRPERFARGDHATAAMPSVSETQAGARQSPRPQPGIAAPMDMPDAPVNGSMPRPGTASSPGPAFMLNVNNKLAMRPKSAVHVPYPEDENMVSTPDARPKSAAPYSQFDTGRQQALPYSARMGGRMSTGPGRQGPQADQLGSAFGIRSSSPGSGAGAQSYSRPLPASASAPGWESRTGTGTGTGTGYRRPSPGPGAQHPSHGHGTGTGPLPIGVPAMGDARSRMQRPNVPPSDKPRPLPAGPPPGQYPQGGYGTQPGPAHNTGRRPVSDTYGRTSPQGGRLPASASAGSLHGDVATPPRRPVTGNANPSGRSSAPPPAHRMSGRPSPQPSMASTTKLPGHASKPSSNATDAHPDGKSMGQGPSTFEEMGIPKGKDKDDCVVM